MKRLKNVHPGEVIKEEFPNELGISASWLTKGTDIPQTMISEIIECSMRITADAALRLSKYFGNTRKILAGITG